MKIDTVMLLKAIILAEEKHDNQLDKGGKPYMEHIMAVVEKCNSIKLKVVAALHDIIEDTDVTASDLLTVYNFPQDIVSAVVCLTKIKGESLECYEERICSNELAVQVKLCDLEHNMDVRRLPIITEIDTKRLNKYVGMYRRISYSIEHTIYL